MPNFGVVDIAASDRAAIAANRAEQQGNIERLKSGRNMAVQQMQDLGALAGTVTDQQTYEQFRGSVNQIYPEAAQQMPEAYSPQDIEKFKSQAAAFQSQTDEQYTLGPGQKRFSGAREIASIAPKPDAKSAERGIKLKRLLGRGVPKEVAEGIVDKTLKTKGTMYGMEATIYDEGTGTVHGRLDAEGNFVPVKGGAYGTGNVADLRGTSVGPPEPQSQADYDAIPSGTKYKHPDGNMRTKP